MDANQQRMGFLIRREDHGDWDDAVLSIEVCHATSSVWERASLGDISFCVGGTTFQFIYEMHGILVVIAGGALDRPTVTGQLEEVCGQFERAVGTPGYVLDMDQFPSGVVHLL